MDLRKTSAWLFLFPLLTGCTTIGTGYRTIVRAPCEIDSSHVEKTGEDIQRLQNELCSYLSAHYPHLVAPLGTKDAALVLRVDPEGRPIESKHVKSGSRWLPTYDHFLKFLSNKYGSAAFRPAELSFKAHDRTVTPVYLATDPRASWAAAVTTILGTTTLSMEERIKLQNLVDARLRHIPDLGPTTAPHHTEICGPECLRNFNACVEGCVPNCASSSLEIDEECRETCQRSCVVPGTVYYYYPRISIDFSSSFLSLSPADRLSYLAMVVRLRGEQRTESARFIDFRPKDAEIHSFSRGDLTQNAKVTIASDLEKASAGDASVFDIGFEGSENLVSKLMDAIEKRSTGILEDGRSFFVDLRSLREIRIAGTYNFDLMLEVPSRLKRGLALESEPLQKEVIADVFLIGVVRHVHDRGRIGTFHRAPESENDHVYEQVVLRVLPEQELWIAPHVPWLDPVPGASPPPACKLQVLTNREDAAFTVRNEKGAPFDGGTGRKTIIQVPTCGKIQVVFLPVVTDKNVLVVDGSDVREVDFAQGQTQSVEGRYLPKVKP